MAPRRNLCRAGLLALLAVGTAALPLPGALRGRGHGHNRPSGILYWPMEFDEDNARDLKRILEKDGIEVPPEAPAEAPQASGPIEAAPVPQEVPPTAMPPLLPLEPISQLLRSELKDEEAESPPGEAPAPATQPIEPPLEAPSSLAPVQPQTVQTPVTELSKASAVQSVTNQPMIPPWQPTAQPMAQPMPEPTSPSMPQPMAQPMPQQMPQQMPQPMPQQMPQQMAQPMPQQMAQPMPQPMPQPMAQSMPQTMAQPMPQQMPQQMPQPMPQQMAQPMAQPDRDPMADHGFSPLPLYEPTPPQQPLQPACGQKLTEQELSEAIIARPAGTDGYCFFADAASWVKECSDARKELDYTKYVKKKAGMYQLQIAPPPAVWGPGPPDPLPVFYGLRTKRLVTQLRTWPLEDIYCAANGWMDVSNDVISNPARLTSFANLQCQQLMVDHPEFNATSMKELLALMTQNNMQAIHSAIPAVGAGAGPPISDMKRHAVARCLLGGLECDIANCAANFCRRDDMGFGFIGHGFIQCAAQKAQD